MDEDDPLVLEHMMGFNGEKPGAVQFHPTHHNVMIAYTGCLVVISNVDDPHKQEFLRGHNEAITCLAISPSGNLIASGQTSTTRVPNSEAIVIVWDFKTREALYRLMELHDGIQFSRNSVTKLAFSSDDAFLAGADDQPGGPKLAVWHTTNAQLAVLKKCSREQSFLSWGKVFANPKRRNNAPPSYELLTAMDEKVLTRKMEFDHVTMQYAMTETQMQLPSSGLMRAYNCAHAVCNGSELIAGSAPGELCVFNVETQVFKACVPVSKGGLLALAVRPDPEHAGVTIAYCGCGDGVLKVLQGGDLTWVCLNETSVVGRILSVTLSADGEEVLVGTSVGNIYRLHAKTLEKLDMHGSASTVPLLASHPRAISCLDFGASSEWFLTASEDGTMRRWELSQYQVDYEIQSRCKTYDATNVSHAECLAIRRSKDLGREVTLSGWTDGCVRAYDVDNGSFLWQIASAHRGAVSAVDMNELYLLTGGKDGSVRVWSDQPSRQLVGNFDEHKKRVTALCVDLRDPSKIHSCSEDKTVVTIDLQQARRTYCHSAKEGALASMCQATTDELELITADTSGNLKWWDCDEAEPVSMLVTWSPHDDPNKERRLTHVSVSPPLEGGSRYGSEYLMACTASGDVQVWDLAEGKPVSIGVAHSSEVTMARWTPDGRQVVSVGKDACICVWNFFPAPKM